MLYINYISVNKIKKNVATIILSQLPSFQRFSITFQSPSRGLKTPAVCPGLASSSFPLSITHSSLATLHAVFWTFQDCYHFQVFPETFFLWIFTFLMLPFHSGFYSSTTSPQRPSPTSLSSQHSLCYLLTLPPASFPLWHVAWYEIRYLFTGYVLSLFPSLSILFSPIPSTWDSTYFSINIY